MLKESYFIGTFPLPPLNMTIISTLIHMISFVTSGSLGSYDPWVVLNPFNIESYGSKMPLSLVVMDYEMTCLSSTRTDSST